MTVKEKTDQIVDQQPEDTSFDEILQELAFQRMIERGLRDAEEGRVISHEEMGNKINSWRK